MTDYKDTVFLPATDFPMRANLPQKEPETLRGWQAAGLDARLAAANASGAPFVLHDGPPYANGNLHIGHALNKILKDVITRTQRMLGRRVAYIPGWDCHGLPIEWKIEEEYRAKKLNKDDVPLLEFRQQCRDYARKWVEIQRGEFQRLGVSGLWDAPYLTMDFPAEGQIVRELHTLVESGAVYQGFKPVLWSVVEQTALAEAEVEYQEKQSTEVYVKFPVGQHGNQDPDLEGAFFLIWTTTPWTLPANAAIAYNEELYYSLIEADGERFIIADKMHEVVANKCGFTSFRHIKNIRRITPSLYDYEENKINDGNSLPQYAGGLYAHAPLPQDSNRRRRLYHADFVTDDAGTGFVHIAPAHGEDDFKVAKESFLHSYDFPQILNKDGTYKSSVPLFAGMHIFKESTTTAILDALKANNALVHSSTFTHSYPHSWRSKKPLIYLATPQWFIKMDAPDNTGIRAQALDALNRITFHPAAGKNRITSMVEGRPDWCISRQRAWGVPIALLTHRETGHVIRDAAVLEKIAAAITTHGCDIWYEKDAAHWLSGTAYNPADYEKVTDILDVWFDSGSTHAFVLDKPYKPDWQGLTRWPADLYLEGSDQHRGWFQSSLLEAIGTRGAAPYKNVLTHGFVLDEQGRKMSKSLGNVVAPQEILDKYGADILRLWVLTQDYYDDVRIGKNIVEQTAEMYRKLRNTLRYLLGALSGYDAKAESLKPGETGPALEQLIRAELTHLKQRAHKAAAAYEFRAFYEELYHFCNNTLSAFYFDVRKDALYCDAPHSLRRRAARGLFAEILECLTRWLAPVLPFTAEEVWHSMNRPGSIHEQHWPDAPEGDTAAARAELEQLRQARTDANAQLEKARAAKTIGSSLQAQIALSFTPEQKPLFSRFDWAELLIVSKATVHYTGAADAAVSLADGHKCPRCWQVKTVGKNPAHPELCDRCTDAVTGAPHAA
ncbi:MAG: isoleucine--tRNA ligase [Thalassospira sp.]|nr:isoleucine--tRNA ligase [Thalassospira sp.]